MNLVFIKPLFSSILWQLLKVLINVLNPFVERNRDDITPKEKSPPHFVSTKSAIVGSVISYMLLGITPSKNARIFIESISVIQVFM